MMIEENAQVVAIDSAGDGLHAWVETQRKTACDACSANKGCGTGIVSKAFGEKTMRMNALNDIGAVVGDAVILGIDDQILVKTSVMTYFIPLLTLMLGGAFGGYMDGRLFVGESEGLTILFGVVGLIVGFSWLRIQTRRLAGDKRYEPQILRFADNHAEIEFGQY